MKGIRLKNISIKGKLLITGILFIFIMVGIIGYFLTRCPIVFKEENVKIEINDSFDAMKNILDVRNGNIDDVKVNTKKVDYH